MPNEVHAMGQFAFAIPGQDSLIDLINPDTGTTLIYNETLAQVQARYPGAEVVSVAEWLAAKAARQHTPITWRECTHERYWEMLEVLPPAVMESGGFMVGEPVDHDVSTGAPRFDAYRQRGDRYFAASRPMTVREFREMAR